VQKRDSLGAATTKPFLAAHTVDAKIPLSIVKEISCKETVEREGAKERLSFAGHFMGNKENFRYRSFLFFYSLFFSSLRDFFALPYTHIE